MTNLLVEVRDGNVEGAMKRFKSLTLKTGLLREIKPRVYVKPGERRRRKSKVARAKVAKVARRIAAAEAAWMQRNGQAND